jgi:hypothetical protein
MGEAAAPEKIPSARRGLHHDQATHCPGLGGVGKNGSVPCAVETIVQGWLGKVGIVGGGVHDGERIVGIANECKRKVGIANNFPFDRIAAWANS